MARLVFRLLLLSVAIAVAIWVAQRPGNVAILWQGWRIDMSTGALGAMVLALAVSAAASYRLWRFLRKAPGQAREVARARRRAAGYKALTEGMVALASGEAEEARRQASKADALLGNPPLTLLLTAQAAQQSGDEDAARRAYEAMAGRPETEFLGLRGLLMLSLRAGERGRALELAERARVKRPDSASVQEALFRLHAEGGAWEDAQRALERLARRRLLPAADARRRQASLLTERSRASMDQGRADEALAQAKRALSLDPALVAAAIEYARALIAAGKARKAQKAIEVAWANAPHPDLAKLYAETLPADALARARGLKALAAVNVSHDESALMLGEAALSARLWGEARTHVAALAEAGSARALRLMARIEEDEQGDQVKMRAFLERAAEAVASEPAWRCSGCGARAERWQAVCGHCGAFGTIGWGTPPSTIRSHS